MKSALKLILLFAICALAAIGCYAPDNAAETAASANLQTLRVVSDDGYPPYAFRDENGALQGIIVDQWALWEKKTGIRVELVGMPWGDALTAMQNGEFDVIDTLFYNDERARLYDFTNAYCQLDTPIFFSSMLSGINGADSLKGFLVAVKRGDYSVDFLKQNGISNLVQYNSYDEIIAAAEEKRVQVFVMDKPPAVYLMAKAGILDRFNCTESLYTGEFHRAVKKSSSALLQQVQNGFNKISADEYRSIDSKWLGNSVLSDRFLPYIGYAIGVALLLLLLLALWNRGLKRMVRKRTTELEQALELLKLKESENAAIISAIPQLIVILDKRGIVQGMLSTKPTEDSKFMSRDMVGRSVFDFLPADAAKAAREKLSRLIETGEMQRHEYCLQGYCTMYLEAVQVICDNNRVLVFISDITQRKMAEQKLYEMSVCDSLTHLYNRNYFEQKIEEFTQSEKAGIGCFSCDLDGLKLINDTLGHSEGDHYIRMAAEIIQSSFDGQDIVARIGGDEFGILVHNASEKLLERKKEEIMKRIKLANAQDRPMPISMSCGYALWNNSSQSLDDAMKDADDCMYRDKLNHMQSMKSKNIELLAKMLEARDFITEGHSERLQELSGRLANAAGLSASDTRDVMLLAKFHDIGKIGIPDAILFKKGSLTEEEVVAMRRHTEIGYRIASSSPDLLHIADWILKHHERYDGSGYPLGLKGREIPIQCRIVAILDAYDAMTNDRPYRKAIPVEDALRELSSCAGTQFDPILVEKFCRITGEWREASNF